jgi:hypothetical protein
MNEGFGDMPDQFAALAPADRDSAASHSRSPGS